MKRYFSIYIKFLKQYLKVLMEYKEDFLAGIVGFFLVQLSSIVFIGLVFNNIPSLKGWSFYEILFIYGFSQIPRGIDHVFTDYLWIFSRDSIVTGEMDRYLLRPLNPYFQVIAQRFQPDGFGELLTGMILIVFSGIKLNISIGFMDILGFIIAVLGGTLIYTGIKTGMAAIAFWTKRSMSYLRVAYEMSGFSKYPVNIYPGGIKGILTFIIPFAFTGYYPAAYILGKESFLKGVLLTAFVGILVMVIAYLIWLKGVKSYESVGN